MGIDRLRAALQRHRRIALDSNVLIYQLEASPKYIRLTDILFEWLALPGSQAITSTITMTEVLVAPYRNFDQKLADKFYGLLSTYPNLMWIPVDLEIADLAARMRARHNFRTPDAVHAATAIHANATALITNDPVFDRISNFDTFVLDRFL